MTTREALIEELERSKLLIARLEDDELNRIQWNAKQWAFMTSHERYVYLSGPNQIGGKTTALNGWLYYHLTGLYPKEWDGPRFKFAPYLIALSVTNEKVQETITDRLFGPYVARGTGYLPSYLFDPKTDLVGMPGGGKGMLKEAYVQHVSGQKSHLRIASYQRGWEALQGSTPNGIAGDEEPHPHKVFDELSARLNKTRGFFRIAASPTHGSTRTRKTFKRNKGGFRYIPYTIYDCDHISEEHKQELLEKYEDNPMAEVRLFGEAAEGEGLIFPVDHEGLKWETFDIPHHYKQIIGVDFAHTPSGYFACCKIAIDPTSDRMYYVTGMKGTGESTATHAEWLRALGGRDIPIAWPHDGGRMQGDGRALYQTFKEDHGMAMLSEPAHRLTFDGKKSNSISPIIQELYDRMRSDRFKVLQSPENRALFEELEGYIAINGDVKPNLDDHLIDAMLKAVMAAPRYAVTYHKVMGNRGAKAKTTIRPRKRDFFSGRR